MNEKEYQTFIKKYLPKETKLKNAVVAFLFGGLLGFISEFIVYILTNYLNLEYKFSTTIMIVILIFISSLLTSLGQFDNLVSFAKAGLIVPITGFAHAMTSSIIDYKNEGLVKGIGSNAFKLTGSVILYGTFAAFIFGFIRYILFGG